MADHSPAPAGPELSLARLTFIGTATMLVELGPFQILTDPNFLHCCEPAYLGYGLWSRRLTEPALGPAQLPPLDAVVLSHWHGNHWDRRARTGLDHSRLRRRQRFAAALGLATWQKHTITKQGQTRAITAVPGVHSLNPVIRALLPPVMGSVLELSDERGVVLRRLYVTGDTMVFEGLDQIAARYPQLDVAVVHTGGTTLPGGFVVTMTGADAAECLRRVRPRVAVPVHYDDYSVFKSGLDDVRRAIDAARLPADVRYVRRGEHATL